MRREYKGAAQPAVLTLPLGGSSANLTITCDDLTNWPTGIAYPFYVVIDRDTPSEEKILCSSRSGNVLTVYNVGGQNGRGADDTSVTAHNVNAVVEHVFTATDADEANSHVNADSGVHGVVGDVVGTSDTQTLTNKTLTTPTIASFAAATHDHESSAGGGTIGVAAISDIASNYFPLNVSTNEETASYTLVLADAQKIVEMNASSANTLTVPTNASVAFPVGTSILVIQTGSGATTIAGDTGVTVNSYTGLKVAGQWAAATLVKRATNTWVAVGALTT